MQEELKKLSVSESLERYIVDLVFASREPQKHGLSEIDKYIQYGASPRASLHLHAGSRALAFLEGRDYVLPEDIKSIAMDVLNHRISLHYEAEAEGISSRDIVSELLKRIPIGR
ncbi:MAG: ATPase, partial [Cytophagales bacterium]|nr:ATPase [Cytophagales bacterium]